MKKIGFLGMGVMGLPMAVNLVKKSGCEIIGYDPVEKSRTEFAKNGGTVAESADDIYRTCSVIIQILPTHKIICESGRRALEIGQKGSIIIDMSSTAPDIVHELYEESELAGFHLIDAPISGGNPAAIAGTLAIMVGGDEEVFNEIKPVLECMGNPVYTGESASGDVTKLVNNIIGGILLTAYAEAYAFAAKAGIDLEKTFEATRTGFLAGPCYENKIPKMLARDYEPGARIAVHRKDIINAKHYAHKLGVDLPLTDVVLNVMDWANDNGHIDEDQAALVKYYEDKMEVRVEK